MTEVQMTPSDFNESVRLAMAKLARRWELKGAPHALKARGNHAKAKKPKPKARRW